MWPTLLHCVCVLPYVTVKGVILEKHSSVSPALLRIPHVLILVDFSCKIPICQCGSSHHHFYQSHEIPQSYQDLYLHFALFALDQHSGPTRNVEALGKQFGTDSIREYIFRSEYFYVMVFFFLPEAMEIKNQGFLFHLQTGGWQAPPHRLCLTMQMLASHRQPLIRSTWAQVRFNVLPSYPTGSDQQVRGQRAGSGPLAPRPAGNHETPQDFSWRFKMKHVIKKQSLRDARERGDSSLFKWQDQGRRARIRQETNTYTGTFWSLRQALLDFLAGEGKTHIVFQFCQVRVQNWWEGKGEKKKHVTLAMSLATPAWSQGVTHLC